MRTTRFLKSPWPALRSAWVLGLVAATIPLASCLAQSRALSPSPDQATPPALRALPDLPDSPQAQTSGPSTSQSNGQLSSGASPSAPSLQTSPLAAAPAPDAPEPITLWGTPKRMLLDQKGIYTSPLRLRPVDAEWLLPLGVATGVLLGSDQHSINDLVHTNTTAQDHAKTISNASVVSLAAIPAGSYLWSLFHFAPQAHETGLLAGEALADSLIFAEAVKFVSRRDRPYVNNAQGNFFSSSFTGSSFPSNHANAAWSMAAVLGDEYPGWLSRTIVYGIAATVSVSRVAAHEHFPSDVLVGSASGWLIGNYVYRKHHNYALDPFNPAPMPKGDPNSPAYKLAEAAAHLPPDPIAHRPPFVRELDADPDKYGSVNVPMDSWVYPALERLAALGLIPGQSVSIRPWTRQECLRQLNEAEEQVQIPEATSASLKSEADHLIRDLRYELAWEPPAYETLTFESAYSRVGAIAGPALQDSFHFGQTWWNDFGRPLGRGTSVINGFSARATHGRLFFYAREEAQHGPGNPAQSIAQNQLFNKLDTIANYGDPTIQPILGHAAYEHYRPIELYAGYAFEGNALTFGKQELYWGPTLMGPWAFSSNAEPTYSLRAVSTRPHPFPFFPALGSYRFDIVLGKLSGHKYPARPWYNGQKADFNFGRDFEISFTRWSVFWGVGHPITLHSFKQNIFSFNSTGNVSTGVGGSGNFGDRTDPGDRKSDFDFHWRLPFLARLVTLYADAYSDDDPNPMDAPRRAAWNPGIYFARLPWLPHMDLRVEAASSTELAHDEGGEHFFWNNQYLDSNTNKGFLLGNAVGRDARAIEGRSGYWFSARTRVELGYRQNKGGKFLPGGSTISDGFLNGSYAISPHWQAQTFLQYERFLIPSYLPGARHNTSGWLQLTWNPQISLRR